MPLGVKAVHSYSATTAITGAWSLTASVSIAAGDLLVVHVVSRSTTTASAGLIVAPTDNAGGTWNVLRAAAQSGIASSVFYNASATTTANFQISLPVENGKTVSGRAAHVLVISGHDGSSPIDLPTYREVNSGAISNTTRTASTSLSTTLGDSLILALVGRFGVVTSASADAAWTRLGNAVNVAGTVNLGLDSFWLPAPTRGIYKFSASLSTGGGTPTTLLALYAVRPAAAGAASASAATSMAFVPTATLAGKGGARGTGAVSLAASAVAAARGALVAASGLDFAPAATLRGRAILTGGAGLTIAASADAGSPLESATATAAVPTQVPATLLGGGWDRLQFRKHLETQRRALMRRAREIAESDDPVPESPPSPLRGIEARLASFTVGPTRQAWRLQEQARALAAIEERLSAIAASVAAQARDRDDEAFLLLAA